MAGGTTSWQDIKDAGWTWGNIKALGLSWGGLKEYFGNIAHAAHAPKRATTHFSRRIVSHDVEPRSGTHFNLSGV